LNPRDPLVEAFEAKIGHRLPDDDRRFLLDGPLPSWSDEDEGDGDDDDDRANPFTDLLHSFYDLGLGEQDDWRSLDCRYESRDLGNFPEWYLGIGERGGVSIGISLFGPRRGRVFSFTRATADDPESELAPSFDAFLQDVRDREADWNARHHPPSP
jgi:hypothetical protein